MRLAAAALAGLVAVGGAIALVLVALDGGGERRLSPPGGDPVVLTSTVSPSRFLFGDRVTAEVKLVVDETRVDPATIVPAPFFRPFRRVGDVEVDRVELGDTTVVRYRYPLQCIDRACAPNAPERAIELPIGLVRYSPRQGDVVTLPLTWPVVEIVSRLSGQARTDVTFRPTEVTADPDLENLPPLGFRAASGLVGWLMVGTAAAIVLGLGAWVALRARPRRREAPAATEQMASTSLEVALARLDEALADGSEQDRRAALDRLARELDAEHEAELAREARALAWSQSGPVSERVAALVRGVKERRLVA